LRAEGAERVFGYPGEIFRAQAEFSGPVEFVPRRAEAVASA
jgi:hypothetical protein